MRLRVRDHGHVTSLQNTVFPELPLFTSQPAPYSLI